MKQTITAITVLLTLCAGAIFGQTEADLSKVFDAYLAGVKAKDFNATMSVLKKQLHDELTVAINTDEKKQSFFESASYTVPLRYEIEFMTPSKEGKVSLYVIGVFPVPEAIQKEQKLPPELRAEVTLPFVLEEGNWKMDKPVLGGDPAERKRPTDLKMGARSDYDAGDNTQIGGVILRMEKQSAGTVLVIRVVDEEIAAFVPQRILPAGCARGVIVELNGGSNKQDSLKFWADRARILDQ